MGVVAMVSEPGPCPETPTPADNTQKNVKRQNARKGYMENSKTPIKYQNFFDRKIA